MSLLSCQDLSYHIGVVPLFSDLSLTVAPGARIGLVGANGSGKSTLLALLSGELAPDGGGLTMRRGLRVRRVPQFLSDQMTEETVLNAALSALPNAGLEQGYVAERQLSELGFGSAQYETPAGHLSGGWQARLLLACALLGEPDVLLLDEPTNHMDLGALLWFERFLQDQVRAAYIVVSHDRQFLDQCTTQTLFLRDRRIYGFHKPFSDARQELVEHDLAAMATRAQEEQQIERLRRSATRLAAWGRDYDNPKFSRRARSMERRIERLQDDLTFVSQSDRRAIGLDTTSVAANYVIRIEDLEVHTPDGRPLFHIDRLYLKREDRVAVLAENGAGKSTFLRILLDAYQRQQDDQLDPACRFNPQLRLAHYDQALAQFDEPTPLLRWLAEAFSLPEGSLKKELAIAGFPANRHQHPVSLLSGGEKARLQFLALKLSQSSLLILDEPTNHLDVDGCEQLEEVILDTRPTIIMTSHDRRFIAETANRFLCIQGGKLVELPEPGPFYARMSQGERLAQKPPKGAPRPQRPVPAAIVVSEETVLARLIEVEADLARRRAEPPEVRDMSKIQWLERQVQQLNAQLEKLSEGSSKP